MFRLRHLMFYYTPMLFWLFLGIGAGISADSVFHGTVTVLSLLLVWVFGAYCGVGYEDMKKLDEEFEQRQRDIDARRKGLDDRREELKKLNELLRSVQNSPKESIREAP